jgi:hypothetical protein
MKIIPVIRLAPLPVLLAAVSQPDALLLPGRANFYVL